MFLAVFSHLSLLQRIKMFLFVSHRETAQLQECSLVFYLQIVKRIIYYFSDQLYLNKHRGGISNVQHQWIRPFMVIADSEIRKIWNWNYSTLTGSQP